MLTLLEIIYENMINMKIYSYLCKLSYVIARAYQNGGF